MTTLVLPPRFSDDTNILWRAAIAMGWNIERLQGWTALRDVEARRITCDLL